MKRQTLSQEEQQDFAPGTAGPGAPHGVLQTGRNKLQDCMGG